jgi:chromatin assembly factor 1 subunit A
MNVSKAESAANTARAATRELERTFKETTQKAKETEKGSRQARATLKAAKKEAKRAAKAARRARQEARRARRAFEKADAVAAKAESKAAKARRHAGSESDKSSRKKSDDRSQVTARPVRVSRSAKQPAVVAGRAARKSKTVSRPVRKRRVKQPIRLAQPAMESTEPDSFVLGDEAGSS